MESDKPTTKTYNCNIFFMILERELSDFNYEKLTAIRKSKLMTQDKLAKLSGLTQTSLSKIEAGITTPRPKTIKNLANALGVDPETFYEENSESDVTTLRMLSTDGSILATINLNEDQTRMVQECADEYGIKLAEAAKKIIMDYASSEIKKARRESDSTLEHKLDGVLSDIQKLKARIAKIDPALLDEPLDHITDEDKKAK